MDLIDRSQSRDKTPWDPTVKNTASMFGARTCEPHLGSGHVRPHQQTGHMAAIASIRTTFRLLPAGGRPHMGPGLRRDELLRGCRASTNYPRRAGQKVKMRFPWRGGGAL